MQCLDRRGVCAARAVAAALAAGAAHALGFLANRASLPDTQRRFKAELENWSRMVAAVGLRIR